MGNILSRTSYAFTTGILGSSIETKTWGYYGSSVFGKECYGISGQDDLWTDSLGNPTYNNETCEEFRWNGRELTYYDTGMDQRYHYSYNADGVRTKKVQEVYGELTTTYYVVEGTKILSEIRDDGLELYFFYDENDAPVGLSYNGTTYYYYKNIFGDIIGIFDASGYLVVRYAYDAWGNPISKTGAMASTLGNANPFRYRGYYYDVETGFYYLNARYYNPEWGRFISSDEVLDTSSAVGCNLFAYCGNDPINRIDESGLFWGSLWNKIKEGFSRFLEVVEAFGEAIEYELGAGAGIGLATSVCGVDLEAVIKEDIINIQQSEGETFIGYYGEESIGVGDLSRKKINAKHSYLGDCDCSGSSEVYKCKNTEKTGYVNGYPGGSVTIFSFKAYFGLGVTVSVGFNWEYFFNRVSEIYS